jgi:hypothetical protein
MKTKLAILTLLATSTLAHATLIDLTPGGFSINNPPPIVQDFLVQWVHQETTIIAGANINGTQVTWSPFTTFGPGNFSILMSDPTSALVGWNLTNTNGYYQQYVLFEGTAGQDNLYRVGGASRFLDSNEFVTIDGQTAFIAIIFFGSDHVPDALDSLVAFAIAVVGLLLTYKLRRRRIA